MLFRTISTSNMNKQDSYGILPQALGYNRRLGPSN